MTLKEYIIKNKNSPKTAVCDRVGEFSYCSVVQSAEFVEKQIKEHLPQGSHIAVFLPDSAEYIIAYYSVLLSDCVVVPIYYRASDSEIEFTINFCDVGAIVTNSKETERMINLQFNNRITVIDVAGTSVSVIGETKKTAVPCSPDNTAIILGTSGSTSTPKRVMLSHENLVSNANAIIKSLNYDENERFLCVLPLTFASGNTSQLIVSLILSASLYIYQTPLHPKLFFNAVQKHSITSVTIVPSVLQMLVSDRKDYSEECCSLKAICFGGAPASPDVVEKAKRSPMADKLVHHYGQTENSPRISHLHFKTEADKYPSVGKPLEGVEVSVSPTGADEKNGEILIKGESVMLGYYKEMSPIKDGWLATGDIGYMDEENYIYITGRKKNIIICSGMNIYPEEVEAVISRHPGVMEVLVSGIDDPYHGELPIAEVVSKSNYTLSEKELKDFCVGKISEYKIPVKFYFRDSLNHTPSGKTIRKRKDT